MQNSATSEHHTPVFNIICYSTPLSLVAPDNQPIFHQAKAPHHRTFSPVINREILQRAARARAVRTLRWLVGSAKGSRWVPGRGPMREVAASNAGRAPDTSRRGAAFFFIFLRCFFSPRAHDRDVAVAAVLFFFSSSSRGGWVGVPRPYELSGSPYGGRVPPRDPGVGGLAVGWGSVATRPACALPRRARTLPRPETPRALLRPRAALVVSSLRCLALWGYQHRHA